MVRLKDYIYYLVSSPDEEKFVYFYSFWKIITNFQLIYQTYLILGMKTFNLLANNV